MEGVTADIVHDVGHGRGSTSGHVRSVARRLTTQRYQAVLRLQVDAFAVVLLRQERQDLVPPHVLLTGPFEIAHQERRPDLRIVVLDLRIESRQQVGAIVLDDVFRTTVREPAPLVLGCCLRCNWPIRFGEGRAGRLTGVPQYETSASAARERAKAGP